MLVMQEEDSNNDAEADNEIREKTSEQVRDGYEQDGDETESNPDPGPPPSYDL